VADQHPDMPPAADTAAAAANGPDGWDACTWDGARRDVLHRAARMTFREKLLWLEEATRLALRFHDRGHEGAGRSP
jgi:hypothetical protein